MTQLTILPTPLFVSLDARTNLATHLWLIFQTVPPVRVPKYKTRRGVTYLCGYTLKWAPDDDLEESPGPDPLAHHFTLFTDTPGPLHYAYLTSEPRGFTPGPSTVAFTFKPHD